MMKIVFDIQCPQMVSGGGQAYTREPGRQGFKSARVNLAILAGDAQNHPELPRWMFDDDPGIYIEGDYEYVHPALVLLGHKRTFWCIIVLWGHAYPCQAHKRNASRHIYRAWRTPRGTQTGRHL